ncbi:MAG: protein kinase [Candidatus Latescibacterota bacterium]|nr:MAG: protein kinase [Candidatus Latescibacterota bacterium]
MIGETISHYNILEKLGEGGMGVVYKAEDTQLDRTVALKFLPPDKLQTKEDVERFTREAKAVSALNHPHIATIYELDEYEGERFIVFEYLPGGTLKTLTKDIGESGRRLSAERIADIGIQILDGLEHAHAKGFIHRDLKPDNLMFSEDGKIKITDFGLAKLKGAAELTKSGSTVGTVSYMSPEQVRGEELDTRSDLFSVGVILYQLVTGNRPFRGEHETAISYAIVNEDPVAPATLRPDLPKALLQIIMRCLEKDKDKRIANAGEVRDALKAVSRKKPAFQQLERPRSRWAALGIAFAVVVAIVAVYPLIRRQPSVPEDRKSIAVLPFDNLSADPENEYFSDGITEDIIAHLSKIADLRVISRTSTMRYKNTDKNIAEIGEELGVGAILEGSVRRAGNKVRVVSQLIDAGTDEHLWADTYDRELKDIFEIQSDVAEKIARALKATLTPQEKVRIETAPTQNMAAYDAYLRGREFYARYSRADNEKAIVLFKKALEFDPHYALAYAGLGDAYGQRVAKYGFSHEWLDSAFTAARTSIELDPELAEGYKALGLTYMTNGECKKALEANKKAVEYNLNYSPAISNCGFVNLHLGRLDEAFYWFKKALMLDLTPGGRALDLAGIGAVYIGLDDFESAKKYLEEARGVNPGHAISLMHLTRLNVADGRCEPAREFARAVVRLVPKSPLGYELLAGVEMCAGNLIDARQHQEKVLDPERSLGQRRHIELQQHIRYAYLLQKTGDVDDSPDHAIRASDGLKAMIEAGADDPRIFIGLAEAAIVLNDKADAYHWLREAIDAGFVVYRFAEANPLFEDIREEPKFKEMMAELRVRVEKMRERVREYDR